MSAMTHVRLGIAAALLSEVSDILHDIEEKGFNLSKQQDQTWKEITAFLEDYYEHN